MPTCALRGKETPRLWTKPLRELTPETSLGFECIDFAENVIGMRLIPWQRWLLIHLLELNPDGTFRFRTAIVLVARQNGKTTLLQVLALWRMYVDRGATVIGTAQDLDVAEETWEGAVDIAEGIPELEVEIKHVDKQNGRKTLRLKTGERYKVRAASRRGGRGLSGELVALDELREHQTWAAWGAVTKTTLARSRAQILGLSNAGDATSIVLGHLRKVAITDLAAAGEAEALAELRTLLADDEDLPDDLPPDDDLSLGIFEWSAPPGCAMDDRDGWAQANPSLGYTITERALRASLKTDDEATFRTECLCQWVTNLEPPIFGQGAWEAQLDVKSKIGDDVVLAVEVSLDRHWSSIVAGGRRPDDDIHVELTGKPDQSDHRRGTRWVVKRLRKIAKKLGYHPLILVDSGGPAVSLVPAIQNAGFDVELFDTPRMTAAAATTYDLVRDGRLWHREQPELDAAVMGAKKRDVGDKWCIGRRKSSVDVTAAVAASMVAYWSEVEGADVTESVW